MTEYKKKLIEVALPLEAINRESAREKSIRHGHPSTLHMWWSRKPLAACRAVLFASLVDDPSAQPDRFPTEADQIEERRRLFAVIEDLIRWENSNDESVLAAAREEIMRSTEGDPPPVLDPFCGGGSIPLEAQRLGLDAQACDLNPVAVLISKGLVEFPATFAGMPPANPESQGKLADCDWRGGQGMAEDLRFYGRLAQGLANDRIGHLYPEARLDDGTHATVIAWQWVRTIVCPNPACRAETPLANKWTLSVQKGQEAWIEPKVDTSSKSVQFSVRTGLGLPPDGTVSRQGAKCMVCGASIPLQYIRSEGTAERLGARLTAVVATDGKRRHFLQPAAVQETTALAVEPEWAPEGTMSTHPQYMGPPKYGLTDFADLFTRRQLKALTTFTDILPEVRSRAIADRMADGRSSESECQAYASVLTTYLAFARDKCADYWNSVATWAQSGGFIRNCFSRQAIPMAWDYTECNPFSGMTGSWESAYEWVARAVSELPSGHGRVQQLDATGIAGAFSDVLVSTDPPYYDNVPYADLSDFFYVWLRHSLSGDYPLLFSTLLTPKSQELVADTKRHAGREGAREFFEAGLSNFFRQALTVSDRRFPMTIYYAFRQVETSSGDESSEVQSSGWEAMLASLLSQGFAVVGTWPIRSERGGRTRANNSNALSTSVVLVCRPRSVNAQLASRREFIGALKGELPEALRNLQHGNIAPVDLAQASIGPGMAVFSRYTRVLEADGSTMSVRTALALINQALDEVVAEQEGEFDADTRWAISWFQEVGVDLGDFGRAELLSKAKNTSVQGMVEAGILEARAGKVRLLRRDELDEEWNPATDKRLTVWEMTQHLIRRLDDGEASAAALARQLGSNAEVARDLAYRLYLICERKKWSQEGQAYNALVVAWPQIQRLAASEPAPSAPSQTDLGI